MCRQWMRPPKPGFHMIADDRKAHCFHMIADDRIIDDLFVKAQQYCSKYISVRICLFLCDRRSQNLRFCDPLRSSAVIWKPGLRATIIAMLCDRIKSNYSHGLVLFVVLLPCVFRFFVKASVRIYCRILVKLLSMTSVICWVKLLSSGFQ